MWTGTKDRWNGFVMRGRCMRLEIEDVQSKSCQWFEGGIRLIPSTNI